MARGKVYINAAGKEVTEGVLGYGGFGVVKIIQWENGDTDAVKIETAEENDEKTEQEILKNIGELIACFKVTRENITEWIHDRKIKNKLYTIQKRHIGTDMWRYFCDVKVSDMQPFRKYELGVQSALAIKKLHDLNILHCDIKPENFMMNWEGATAIVAPIDFGFSEILSSESTISIGDARGTLPYMAPEITNPRRVLDSKSRYSKASDIYALGKMFKDDLRLDKTGPDLKKMIKEMLNDEYAKRSTIDEVIKTMQSARVQQHLKKYTKKQSWFHKNQAKMSKELQTILEDYASYDNSAKESVKETVINEIISQMQENQKRHEKKPFYKASTFNITLLKNLPEELRDGVYKELGIEKNSKILTEKISYDTRKELAKLIHDSIEASKEEEPLEPKK